MKLLYLDPYHAGSHAACARAYAAHSRHAVDLRSLPGRHWKWRLRHAALSFADRIRAEHAAGSRWDAVIATGMLDLAQWRGLIPAELAERPHILYMHENQAAYPDAHPDARDVHFPLSQLCSCRAADQVWWNSRWNQESFQDGLRRLLQQMPDRELPDPLPAIAATSRIMPPGIDPVPPLERRPGPLRILHAARWEADKNIAQLVHVLGALVDEDVDFQVALIGPGASTAPPELRALREGLGARVWAWGEQPAGQYRACLQRADVVLSCAAHEFFGLAVVEAASAACLPLVPRALAYPAVFERAARYHDGSAEDIIRQLRALASDPSSSILAGRAASRHVRRYHWSQRAAAMDAALENLS